MHPHLKLKGERAVGYLARFHTVSVCCLVFVGGNRPPKSQPSREPHGCRSFWPSCRTLRTSLDLSEPWFPPAESGFQSYLQRHTWKAPALWEYSLATDMLTTAVTWEELLSDLQHKRYHLPAARTGVPRGQLSALHRTLIAWNRENHAAQVLVFLSPSVCLVLLALGPFSLCFLP